jgi:hypothetical protein
MKMQRRSGLQIATVCNVHYISDSEQKDVTGSHKDVIGSRIKKRMQAPINQLCTLLHQLLKKVCTDC